VWFVLQDKLAIKQTLKKKALNNHEVSKKISLGAAMWQLSGSFFRIL
jgi:hypothetical protein